MQKFRFCSLPETYQVGSVALLPRNNSARRLRPCCVCRKVSLNSYRCASDHSFCPDCFISPGLYRKWCVICDDFVEFNEENLRIDAVEDMEFTCACNFGGTLTAIREHLLRTLTPRMCYAQEPTNVEHPPRLLTPPYDVIGQVKQTRQILRKQEEEKHLISIVADLVESCCHTRAICDVLSGDEQIFCFEFKELVRTPLEQHTVVDGAPLRIQVAIEGLRDEPVLSVYVAGSCEVAARYTQWPLRKRIKVDILDAQGRSHAYCEFLTYRKGKYTHPSFVDPTPDPTSDASSEDVSSFINLAEVRGFYQRDDSDYLILAVRVYDLKRD